MNYFNQIRRIGFVFLLALFASGMAMSQSFPFPSGSSATGTPAIVEFNNKLVMVYLDASDLRLMYRESINGSGWSGERELPTANNNRLIGYVGSGVGAIAHNGRLYVTFGGRLQSGPGSDNATLNVLAYDASYNSVGVFTLLPDSNFSRFNLDAGSFASVGSELFLQVDAPLSTGTRVKRTYLVRSNGFPAFFSDQTGFSGRRSALANFGGNLYMFAETNGQIQVLVRGGSRAAGVASLSGAAKDSKEANWNVVGTIPGSTNNDRGALSAITFDGKIHLFESGLLGRTGFINLRTTATPNVVNSYTAPTSVVSPVGSNATAATVFQSSLYIAYRNAGNAQMTFQIVGQNLPPLIAPFGLTATFQLADGQVVLNWRDNNSDETGFVVQRSVNNGPFEVIGQPTNTGSNLTDIDPDVSFGNNYRYRVAAKRGPVTSGFSNIANATFDPGLDPPSNLTATHEPANNRVRISWTDSNPDETGFVVQRSVNSSPFSNWRTLNATGTNLVTSDTAMAAGGNYRYRVKAVKNGFGSAFSNIASVTIAVGVNAPSNLRATTLSSSSIRLTWNDNSNNETGFRIERSINGGSFSFLKNVTANQTFFTNNGLQPATTYRYRVFAFNPSATSAASNVAGTATSSDLPAAPSGLVATYDATAVGVDFSWNDNSNNETGFEIEFRLIGTVDWEPLQVAISANQTSTSTSVQNVLGDRTFEVRIRAFNSAGTSGWSNIETIYLPPNPFPLAPTNLTASYNAATNTINLAWNDNSDNELGFTIEFSVSSGQWSPIVGQPGANQTTKVISNPPCCFIYAFRIRSWNNRGFSVWTEPVNVLVTGSTAARNNNTPENVTSSKGVVAYPNPFSEVVNLKLPPIKGDGISLTITSAISGKVVKTFAGLSADASLEGSEISWNGTDDRGNRLDPGTYIYQLKTKDAVVTGRLVLKK
ncbi:MAG: fibronectin type III domain-containing protein [Bacteroidota bacterium]